MLSKQGFWVHTEENKVKDNGAVVKGRKAGVGVDVGGVGAHLVQNTWK